MKMIITQILGAVALIVCLIGIFFNKKKNYIITQIISYVFNGAAFIVNGSLVAGINTIVSISRALVLYFYERKGKNPPTIIILICYSAIYLTIGIVFMSDYLEIITMITPILFTLSMLMKNMQLIRYYSLLPNVMLATYGFLTAAYTSASFYVVQTIALIVAIINHYIQRKKQRNYII